MQVSNQRIESEWGSVFFGFINGVGVSLIVLSRMFVMAGTRDIQDILLYISIGVIIVVATLIYEYRTLCHLADNLKYLSNMVCYILLSTSGFIISMFYFWV